MLHGLLMRVKRQYLIKALKRWLDVMAISHPHIINVSEDPLPVHHPNTILKSLPDAPAGQTNQRDHPLNRGQVMSKPRVVFLPRQSAVTGQGPVEKLNRKRGRPLVNMTGRGFRAGEALFFSVSFDIKMDS